MLCECNDGIFQFYSCRTNYAVTTNEEISKKKKKNEEKNKERKRRRRKNKHAKQAEY